MYQHCNVPLSCIHGVWILQSENCPFRYSIWLSFFYIVLALNPWKDPDINLLAIFGGAGVIHLWAWLSGGVYKNWCLDVLAHLFLTWSYSVLLTVMSVTWEEISLQLGTSLFLQHSQHSLASLPTSTSSN